MREAKRGSLATIVRGPWQRNAIVIYIFTISLYFVPNIIIIKRSEERKLKDEKINSQNNMFWAYFKNLSTSTFWCVVTPLGPHSIYT
jgi:hypothetical protein